MTVLDWRRQLQAHQFNQPIDGRKITSLQQIADTLLPVGIDCVAFKALHQTNFIGRNHDSSPLGIKSVDEAAKRVEGLRAAGIEGVIWTVPTGAQWAEEVRLTAQLAQACGQVMLNLEEGWDEFWALRAEDFPPFLDEVITQAGGAPIDVCFDTVYRNYDAMLTDRWAPKARYLLPEAYSLDFGWSVSQTLSHCVADLGRFGLEKLVPTWGLNAGAYALGQAGQLQAAAGVQRCSGWVLWTSNSGTRAALGQQALAELPVTPPAPGEPAGPDYSGLVTDLTTWAVNLQGVLVHDDGQSWAREFTDKLIAPLRGQDWATADAYLGGLETFMGTDLVEQFQRFTAEVQAQRSKLAPLL